MYVLFPVAEKYVDQFKSANISYNFSFDKKASFRKDYYYREADYFHPSLNRSEVMDDSMDSIFKIFLKNKKRESIRIFINKGILFTNITVVCGEITSGFVAYRKCLFVSKNLDYLLESILHSSFVSDEFEDLGGIIISGRFSYKDNFSVAISNCNYNKSKDRFDLSEYDPELLTDGFKAFDVANDIKDFVFRTFESFPTNYSNDSHVIFNKSEKIKITHYNQGYNVYFFFSFSYRFLKISGYLLGNVIDIKIVVSGYYEVTSEISANLLSEKEVLKINRLLSFVFSSFEKQINSDNPPWGNRASFADFIRRELDPYSKTKERLIFSDHYEDIKS